MIPSFAKVLFGASAAIAVTTLSAPAAQAFGFTFAQTFESAASLTGEFSGTDLNGDGSLQANEFTSFTSLFTGDEAGFESVSWGLGNLSTLSFFTSPENFAFIVTNVGSDRGWQSFSFPGEGGQTNVGFAPTADLIDGRFLSQEPIALLEKEVAAVPEPTTMAGLALAGIGMHYARRRQQRG